MLALLHFCKNVFLSQSNEYIIKKLVPTLFPRNLAGSCQ